MIMETFTNIGNKCWHTVIIGAGQAGLATGYYLKMMNENFIILDENENIGDAWRKRWDSLKLFTPSQYDCLPGMPYPGPKNSYPGKDQLATYLSNYTDRFGLPVKTNCRVNHLTAKNNHFEIESSAGNIFADNVVVATGTNPLPSIPAFASEISPAIFQLHSSKYQNPASVPDGDVLVVGAGTSGVEIALELSKTHNTFISGKPTFHIPDNVLKYAGRLYWLLVSNILTIRTPIGRKAKQSIVKGGGPLIRVSADELNVAGVKRFPRMTGVKEGFPGFDEGITLKVASIIWCTGFKPDFSWIEMDITDETGWPDTKRGVSSTIKGLYFAGMRFQYGLTSGLVGGVGRDAKYISRQILKQNI